MAPDMDMFTVARTIGSVLCCECGISMQPTAANMCAKCLRTVVNITEGLPLSVVINHCPECDSYLQPPSTWTKAQRESKELLVICLKRLKNFLKKFHLVHAEFIWTEPHSKRIKIKLKVQKEVINGAILEQAHIVEYKVWDKMCDGCSRVQANPDQWEAVVQLRQYVSHRRTFFYVEQMILKHDAAKNAIRIKQMRQGIDIFFNTWSHGMSFINFLGGVVPVNNDQAKQLVSHDSKSNKCIYKYTLPVEICPICREDLICLPPEVAISLGNLGPLVICNKLSYNIALLDPFTLRQTFLNAKQYWRSPFKALLSSRQLVGYIVLDVDVVSSEINVSGSKYVLADAQVARLSDFGKNDLIFSVRTHLGHLLTSGDYALGYDLYGANINSVELDKYNDLDLPHAILIKKICKEKLEKWGKHCNTGNGRDGDENSDYEQFLRDLDENPDLTFNLSLHPDGEIQPSKMASMTTGEDVAAMTDGEDVLMTSYMVNEFEDLDLGDAECHDDSMKD